MAERDTATAIATVLSSLLSGVGGGAPGGRADSGDIGTEGTGGDTTPGSPSSEESVTAIEDMAAGPLTSALSEDAICEDANVRVFMLMSFTAPDTLVAMKIWPPPAASAMAAGPAETTAALCRRAEGPNGLLK